MKPTAGTMIRARRAKADLTTAALARRLAISEAYLRQLEADNHVHLSERVVGRLQAVLGLRLPAALVTKHNKRSTAYYRAYRAARKAA